MKSSPLPHRIARKLKYYATVIFRSLPVNTKLRPLGARKLLPNDDTSIEYLEIRPPYSSILDLPSEFIAECSEFCKPVLKVDIPGDYIVTLRNGRVYSFDPSNTAIISESNYLIEDLSFQWTSYGEVLQNGANNKVFTVSGFMKPRKYNGRVFSLLGGGGAKYYYYHWMIDSLAKLGLLKESGLFDKVDYFLVPSYSAKYHKETLDHFGIPKSKIINEEVENHIQADYLMVASYTQIEFHHPKWVCDFLHTSFTNPAPKKRDKLIYIPRGDAAINRKVLNEPELIEFLQGYGFTTHNLADMEIHDEAEYFNSARLVLGVQGSGFANLVFCEPGTKVVQFFPHSYVRHIDYDLANKMDLEYHYLICPSDATAYDTVEGQKINVYADIPAIKAKLDALLK
jgi:hypothetical protein